MYGITEIRKRNGQLKADALNHREASYTSLRDGSILLRYRAFSKVLSGKKEVKEFLRQVKGASSGKTRAVVEGHFDKAA